MNSFPYHLTIWMGNNSLALYLSQKNLVSIKISALGAIVVFKALHTFSHV